MPHGGDDGSTGLIVFSKRTRGAAHDCDAQAANPRRILAVVATVRFCALTVHSVGVSVIKGWFAWYSVQAESTRSSLQFWLVFAPAN
jgi:hypothetical protein